MEYKDGEKRVCRICGEKKLLSEYYYYIKKDKRYRTECKKCNNKQSREYRKNNKEKLKEKREKCYKKNKEKICKSQKKYAKNNKEKIAERLKRYRKENKEKIKEQTKGYREEHKEELKEYAKNNREMTNKKQRDRRRGNLSLRLNSNMSVSIRQSLKSNNISKNRRHWEDLIGYTVQELKYHLEKLFLPGMTWKNYGRIKGVRCWEIDHIIPVDFFEFTSTDDVEFKYLWSLGNLQPLWAVDNQKKGNKIILQ